MYSPDILLKEFVASIPICQDNSSLETILSAFQVSSHGAIAIVNAHQSPLGIITSDRLLCFLSREWQNQAITMASSRNYLRHRIDLPSIHHFNSLIETTTILASEMKLEEFLPYLKNFMMATPKAKASRYLVIDAQKGLLGLLDTQKLLTYLVFNSQLQPANLQQRSALEQSICSLIEQLELPLMLQTADSRILYQNSCWQKSIEHQKQSDLTENKEQQPANRQSLAYLVDVPQPHFHCLKGNNYLGITSSFNYQHNYFKGGKFNGGKNGILDFQHRGEKENLLPTTPPKHESVSGWHYLKFPLHLTAEPTQSEKQQPQYWLILATRDEIKQLSSHNSKDAELIQLNLLKDELLANIGHELKSPLTGIVGLASLLKEQKLGNLNQRQLHYAELIYRNGRRLMNIVSDLLDLTNLATGKLMLNLEPVEIEILCHQTYQQVLSKLTSNLDTDNNQTRNYSDRTFQLDIDSGIATAIADKLRLSQILAHLLHNVVVNSQPQSKIGIKVTTWNNWLAFTVWQAKSSSNQQLTSLADEPIWQTVNQKGDLGSVLAQRLAMLHGGDISFTSRADRGSEFTLLIPARNGAVPETGNLERLITEKQHNLLVLLIETQARQISELSLKLTELGYHPIVARTGTEALHKARQLKPSHILLNPDLPMLSGQDVVTLLKSDSRTQNIPLLIITNSQNRQQDQQLYQQVQGFVSQPLEQIDLATLLPKIGQQTVPQKRNLTILCLYPELELTNSSNRLTDNLDFNLKDWAERDWTNQNNAPDNPEKNNYRCRIIEADGLEQAHMLARIWQLDAIVLDGYLIKNPLEYLRSLQESEYLAKLPLIVLDAKTSAAANQIESLNVYPCLVPAECRNIADLMQVIQIATEQDESTP